MCLPLCCVLLRSGDFVLVDACQLSASVNSARSRNISLGGHFKFVWYIHFDSWDLWKLWGRLDLLYMITWCLIQVSCPTRLVLRTCRMWSMSRCRWTEPCGLWKMSSFLLLREMCTLGTHSRSALWPRRASGRRLFLCGKTDFWALVTHQLMAKFVPWNCWTSFIKKIKPQALILL